MEVSLRNVIRRGLSHELNCEDEALSSIFNSSLAIMAVFDGCSKGTKSHFASGLMARILKKIMIQDKSYFEQVASERELKEVVKYITRRLFLELRTTTAYLELTMSEVLATMVLAVVDLNKKTGFAIMIGDGSFYVDGVLENIDCPNNAPNYLAHYINNDDFETVWKEAVVYSKEFVVNETVAVLTDGIDSFYINNEGRYVTDSEKEIIVERLLKSDYLLKNKVGLARICNILQDGVEIEKDVVKKMQPRDDLAISRLTFISPVDDSIQQTGTED